MTEWTVVTVLITVVGLVITVLKPLLALNSTISRLTKSVEALEKQVELITEKNSDSHTRIWQHIASQDERLYACEGLAKSGTQK